MHLSDIDFPARRRRLVALAHAALAAWRLRATLPIAAVGVTLLVGASVATAQDITNTTPFSNSAPYAGNVLSNTSTIGNNGPGGSWVGNIVSNFGSVTNTGTGAVWTGSVSNDNSVNNENGATWVGDIVWNNNGIRNKAGSTWQGDVLSNGGANSLTLIDNRGTWVGAVRGNTTRIFTHGGSWTGDIVGNTGNIYNNYHDATLNPGGVNAAVWTGTVLSNSFLIINFQNGTWNGDVVGNPGDIANYGAWNGNLNNSGRIIHTGVWTGNVVNNGTFFRAENQIVGAFDNRGSLQLTGNLSGITTLTNSGRLELTHTSGSQTLSVANAVFKPSSSYEIDVNSAGATDRVVVSGNAALDGTVRVVAAPGGAAYSTSTSYTILSAGSISGQFAGATTTLAFLAPRLSYDASAVYLTLLRNDVGFAATGATGNQAGVGVSVEMLRAGNPLYDAVLWLTPQQARQAFDMLSGEAHSSAGNVAVDMAGLVGGVALNRLNQTFRDTGRNAFASHTAADPIAADPATDSMLWTKFYGAVGRVAAGTGTSSLTSSNGGVAVGLDGLYQDWRVGMMMHAGYTSSAVSALGSTIGSADFGLGLYGGREWGDTRLALGAIYTRHDIRSARTVAFPGFTDVLTSQYAAGTAQAFAELSHAVDLGAVLLRPYANLAHISRSAEKFAETGGAAALSGAGSTISTTFTTLGLQAERQFMVGGANVLTASGSMGWRHAFADTPVSTYALAGGPSFSVVGAPIAREMLALNASLSHDVSATSMVDVSYDGLLGEDAQVHALKGTWAMRF
jgi:outer membrane autotransporter protein